MIVDLIPSYLKTMSKCNELVNFLLIKKHHGNMAQASQFPSLSKANGICISSFIHHFHSVASTTRKFSLSVFTRSLQIKQLVLLHTVKCSLSQVKKIASERILFCFVDWNTGISCQQTFRQQLLGNNQIMHTLFKSYF